MHGGRAGCPLNSARGGAEASWWAARGLLLYPLKGRPPRVSSRALSVPYVRGVDTGLIWLHMAVFIISYTVCVCWFVCAYILFVYLSGSPSPACFYLSACLQYRGPAPGEQVPARASCQRLLWNMNPDLSNSHRVFFFAPHLSSGERGRWWRRIGFIIIHFCIVVVVVVRVSVIVIKCSKFDLFFI